VPMQLQVCMHVIFPKSKASFAYASLVLRSCERVCVSIVWAVRKKNRKPCCNPCWTAGSVNALYNYIYFYGIYPRRNWLSHRDNRAVKRISRYRSTGAKFWHTSIPNFPSSTSEVPTKLGRSPPYKIANKKKIKCITAIAMLKLQHQISIAWELDEVLFFFFLLFLSLESFLCLAASSFFAAAGSCVASRCWWIAANGSSWNCGLFRTAFRWADSRSLQNRVGFLIQNHRWKLPRPEARKQDVSRGLH